MPVWNVTVADRGGNVVGSFSTVGNMADALVRAVEAFPTAFHVRVRQMQIVKGVKGTDGADWNGISMKALLPTHVTWNDPPDDEDDKQDEKVPAIIGAWLAMKFHPFDKGHKTKRHSGDPKCRCSRCGKKIRVVHQSIGFEAAGRHYRYHASCLDVDYVLD